MPETVVEAEIEELTDADLEAQVPCECKFYWLWEFRRARAFKKGDDSGAHQCRWPAVARMRIACFACGARYHLFLCRIHSNGFRSGKKVSCRVCFRFGQVKGTES